MNDFETLLAQFRPCVERYIRYRLPHGADCDDVLQETCLAAYLAFSTLQDTSAFKPWLLSIARNKCADWFRRHARRREAPLETALERGYLPGPFAHAPQTAVEETMERLSAQDRLLLTWSYDRRLPQKEIAQRLNVPIGTVKSRLSVAKARFRTAWTHPPKQGGINMNETTNPGALPAVMPAYTVKSTGGKPFEVVWEELPGWLLVPRLGERISWAMYDDPDKKRTFQYDMRVLGEAEVHGIRGVEIEAVCHGVDPTGAGNPSDTEPTRFIAQLTDTHCRYLACEAMQNGVKRFITFLDGEAFMPNWGVGENNCGNETHLVCKGRIHRDGNTVSCSTANDAPDIVGRYEVTIGGRVYDTVCVMDIDSFNDGTLSEQFLDRNGKTVLWRRFNRDDWHVAHGEKRWSEKLPASERLTVNGQVYVHWYDCLTDYVPAPPGR